VIIKTLAIFLIVLHLLKECAAPGRIAVKETKILLAMTSNLVIMACLAPSETTEQKPTVPVLLTDAETQPWSALSDYLIN